MVLNSWGSFADFGSCVLAFLLRESGFGLVDDLACLAHASGLPLRMELSASMVTLLLPGAILPVVLLDNFRLCAFAIKPRLAWDVETAE